MNTAIAYATQQYEWVKESREVLFAYCRTISVKDFTDQNTSFGRGGSVRNLLVHNANTYQFWIGKISLHKNIEFTPFDSCAHIDQVIACYASVDHLMQEFVSFIDFEKDIMYDINGSTKTAPPCKVFTHVITHEFHHKGQILSLTRHLGYTPIDTDIMR